MLRGWDGAFPESHGNIRAISKTSQDSCAVTGFRARGGSSPHFTDEETKLGEEK